MWTEIREKKEKLAKKEIDQQQPDEVATESHGSAGIVAKLLRGTPLQTATAAKQRPPQKAATTENGLTAKAVPK